METLRRAFFEDPLYLYVAAALAEAILFVIWRETRKRGLALALLAPVAFAACVFAVSRFVVTDREQIVAATEEIAADVQAGRTTAAEKYLAEDFTGYYRTKQHALDEARSAIETYRFKLIELKDVEVAVTGRRAVMSLTTVVIPGAGLAAGRRFSHAWDVHWVKLPAAGREVWRIIDVVPKNRPGP